MISRLLLLFALIASVFATQCLPAAEVTALYNFYSALGGTSWTSNSGWYAMTSGGSCPCDGTMYVTGVSCTGSDVNELNLPSNGLAGVFPNLSALTKLEYLILDGNAITCTGCQYAMPTNMGDLVELQILKMKNNYLAGALPPSLGNCQHLQKVDLSGNLITSLPATSTWADLTELILKDNSITTLPVYSASTKLDILDVSNNKLTALDDGWFTDVTSITELELGGNALTRVPTSITNLVDAYKLGLSSNSLTTIPPLAAMAALEFLDVSHNALTSLPALPDSVIVVEARENKITDASALNGYNALQTIDLNSNKLTTLTGTLPASIGSFEAAANAITTVDTSYFSQARGLTNIDLSSNALTDFPANLCGNGWQLETLDLSHNYIGYVEDFSGCKYLEKLYLHNNKITSIPNDIWTDLKYVTYLDLSYNKFTSIPDEIGELTGLVELHLANTPVKTISTLIGTLPHLETLDLSMTALTSVPAGVKNLPSLYELDMSYSTLTVESDAVLESLTQVRVLDISGNPFTGGYPDLSNLPRLKTLKSRYCNNAGVTLEELMDKVPGLLSTLDLAWNDLEGAIPSAVANLVKAGILKSVDLSNNKLTGWIPEALNLPQGSRPALDLSGNKFFCPVPSWAAWTGASSATCITVKFDRVTVTDVPTVRSPGILTVHGSFTPASLYQCAFYNEASGAWRYTDAEYKDSTTVKCVTPVHTETEPLSAGKYKLEVTFDSEPISGDPVEVTILDPCSVSTSCGQCTKDAYCLWSSSAHMCSDELFASTQDGWSRTCAAKRGAAVVTFAYHWAWMGLLFVILVLVFACISTIFLWKFGPRTWWGRGKRAAPGVVIVNSAEGPSERTGLLVDTDENALL
ncbi:Leucine rich repeat [Carpediemonas membranifera]|uniref:Leucine rich repeat n=1 Tax=Carpediemonas membranifera TaxID=201153 RepID=A0A8J6AWX0_9EUKA|nr:Leucine rich repeat [Carpediemonas membranifera]|eukprot:KAG9394535.1 Leucine rich repeat [Carpediemonas membranifera]